MRVFVFLFIVICVFQLNSWDLAEFTASDFLKLTFSQQIGWVQGYILGSWVVLKQLSVDGMYSELYSNFYVNLKDTEFHAYLIEMCRRYRNSPLIYVLILTNMEIKVTLETHPPERSL